MHLLCLLAILGASPQDPPHEPTMLERIDALIAKTNACEGFVVRYQLHGSDGSESALRIAYRSPAELVIDLQGEMGRSFTRFRPTAADCMWIKEGAAGSKASIRDWNPSARFVEELRGLLEKEFPGTLRLQDLSARESSMIELSIAPDDSSIGFNFGIGYSSDPRLGWLDRARRQPERVSVGGNDLVWACSAKSSVFISTETGFVTRIEKRTESGVRCGLELTALTVDTRPADSEFELPGIGGPAGDMSDDFASAMEGQALSNSRADLFWVISRMLDDGRIQWTEESPTKIERVMRGMRAIDLEPTCTRLLRKSQASIEEGSDRLREALRAIDLQDPEVLADQNDQMERSRQKLEGQLASFLEREITNGMPRGKCKARPSLYEELGVMEKRVLSDVFAELVMKPVLTAFDEKLGKQLEAK